MIIKALIWLSIIIVGFFLLMLVVYVAARITMSGFLDEINKMYENSLKQLKQNKNDKEEKK